jgi:hypothetical protein
MFKKFHFYLSALMVLFSLVQIFHVSRQLAFVGGRDIMAGMPPCPTASSLWAGAPKVFMRGTKGFGTGLGAVSGGESGSSSNGSGSSSSSSSRGSNGVGNFRVTKANTAPLGALWQSVWDELYANNNGADGVVLATNSNPVNNKMITLNKIHHRTFGNAIPSTESFSSDPASSLDSGITLVTHSSVDKLPRLLLQVQQWAGPVSAAIYLSSRNDITTFLEFYRQHEYDLTLVAFSVLLEAPLEGTGYPHNLLRNLALDHATATNYFLNLDVDFVTPRNGHDRLASEILDNNLNARDMLRTRTLLVLPAFEQLQEETSEQTLDETMTVPVIPLPETKSDLVALLDVHRVTPYHLEQFPQGHGPSNYEKWVSIPETPSASKSTRKSASRVKERALSLSGGESRSELSQLSLRTSEDIMYEVDYQAQFEPYVIGYRPGVPRYWDAFRGFGFDKISWCMEAHYAGYQYAVLHDFFVLHLFDETTATHHHNNDNPALSSFGEYLQDTYHVDWTLLKRVFGFSLVHTPDYNRHLHGRLVQRVKLAYEAHEKMEGDELLLSDKKKHTNSDVDRLILFATPMVDLIQKETGSHTPNNSTAMTVYSNKPLEDFLKKAEALVYSAPGHPYEQLWDREFASSNIYTHRATFPNAFLASQPVDRGDVTMATHTSVSKLERLLYQIEKWAGPTSVAMYLSSKEQIREFLDWYRDNSDLLRPYTTFHVVLERPADNVPYPHNILRNLALDHVKTDYFLALDVDFLMNRNCHSEMKTLIATHTPTRHALKHNKTLFVLPAFERFDFGHDLTPDLIPDTKAGLKIMLENGTVAPFHLDVFPPGHGPTDFPKWLDLPDKGESPGPPQPDEAVSYPIDFVHKFEPYVLGYRFGVPRYWPYFRGFGFDKLSWLMEAHYAGYRYEVLHDYFVVHMNHDKPNSGITNSDEFMNNLKRVFLFNTYLNEKYGAEYDDANAVFGPLIRRVDEKVEYDRAQLSKRIMLAYNKKWFLKPWEQQQLFSVPLEDYLNHVFYDMNKVKKWLYGIESRFPPNNPELKLKYHPLYALYDFEFGDRPDAGHNVTQSHVIRSQKAVHSNDVSLVTYGSVKMLHKLMNQIQQWDGPASVSIYITGPADVTRLFDFFDEHSYELEYAAFHILMEDGSLAYPHSMLMNLALDNAETKYVFTVDSDFATPKCAHENLQELIMSDQTMRSNLEDNYLYIAPTFIAKKVRGSKDRDQFPESRADMVALLEKGKAETHTPSPLPRGSAETSMDKWWETKDKMRQKSADVGFPMPRKRSSFEPTALGYLPNFPRYWNGYRGEDYQKLSWNLESYYTGQSFILLWDFYVYGRKSGSVHPKTPAASVKYRTNALGTFSEYLAEKGATWVALENRFGKKGLHHSDGHYLTERVSLIRRVTHAYKVRQHYIRPKSTPTTPTEKQTDTDEEDSTSDATEMVVGGDHFALSPEAQLAKPNKLIRDWLMEVEPLIHINSDSAATSRRKA